VVIRNKRIEIQSEKCAGRLVILVDEIDVVRSLPFSTDEFFAAIREYRGGRGETKRRRKSMTS
jgi:hypothetical protein